MVVIISQRIKTWEENEESQTDSEVSLETEVSVIKLNKVLSQVAIKTLFNLGGQSENEEKKSKVK